MKSMGSSWENLAIQLGLKTDKAINWLSWCTKRERAGGLDFKNLLDWSIIPPLD